jgi:hypothetical protein
MFAEDSAKVRHYLLRAILRVSATANVSAVEVSLLHTNPWLPFLKKRGFLLRQPPSEVYVFTGKENSLHRIVNNPASWYMTQGDRDT